MKTRKIAIEFPLNQIFLRCETLCVQACCGADAYDISSIHIASIVSMDGGKVNQHTMRKLKEQAYVMENGFNDDPNANNVYSLTHAHGQQELFGSFSRVEIEKMAQEIIKGLELAPAIVEYANKLSVKNE